ENRQTNKSIAYVWNMQTGETLAEFPCPTDDREAFSNASSDAHKAMEVMTADGVRSKDDMQVVIVKNPSRFRARQKPVKTSNPQPVDFDKLAGKSLRLISKIRRSIKVYSLEEQQLIVDAIRNSEYLP